MIETISELLEHAEKAMKFVNKGGAFLEEAGRKSILQGHDEAVMCVPCGH